jgi:DNA repair protein RadA/Sms
VSMNIHIGPTKCKECGYPLKSGTLKCVNRKCGHWNTGNGSIDLDEHTVLLSDAKLSNVERIFTGIADHIFGGGIATTSVNLLAGEPGSGKTTLCLQLCNIIAKHFQREALYIANEQDASELRDTATRLELDSAGLIRVVKGMGGLTFDLGDMLMRYKPCLIVLDSVTKWSGDDPAAAVTICNRLKDYSVALKAPSIVVNQVTKSGDHAGLNKMLHAVDMCCIFELLHESEDKVASNKTLRHLWSTKNRFGPAPEEQYYLMRTTGLINIEDTEGLPEGKEGYEDVKEEDPEEEDSEEDDSETL